MKKNKIKGQKKKYNKNHQLFQKKIQKKKTKNME